MFIVLLVSVVWILTATGGAMSVRLCLVRPHPEVGSLATDYRLCPMLLSAGDRADRLVGNVLAEHAHLPGEDAGVQALHTICESGVVGDALTSLLLECIKWGRGIERGKFPHPHDAGGD